MDERWHSFSSFCRRTYGRRLYRAALDAGMNCPNRDGTCGSRGCIFCSEGGSGDYAIRYEGQKLSREDLIWNHDPGQAGDYIAYFQAFTNTYAPLERLEFLYRSALADPLFAGISIATRADCLGEEVIALLSKLKQEFPDKFIWAELGLQSVHDNTVAWMRRGYPHAVFEEGIEKLRNAGIPVIAHVILGFPQETKEDMLETVRYCNRAQVSGIKLQLLHYLKHTDLGAMYEQDRERFHVLTFEEYIDILCDCIGNLDPHIVIHRLTGDGAGTDLLAPLWSRDKKRVINTIRHELKMRGIVQGSLIKEEK